MLILSSSHIRGPLSSERCVQKGVRRLSRRRYAIRSAKVGLGIVLAGQILARLGLTQGYAGTITSAIEADEIPPFRLHNVTVEQIANHIVTLQNRGAWILYPPGRTMKEKAEDAHLRIYGYKDDLRALEAESCPAP